MALLPLPPARVFAELLPQAAGEGRSRGREAEPGREVHVSGCAERSAAPDRARVRLRLGSTKGAAGEARSSVSRRLDYVVHSARQRGVPVGPCGGRGRAVEMSLLMSRPVSGFGAGACGGNVTNYVAPWGRDLRCSGGRSRPAGGRGVAVPGWKLSGAGCTGSGQGRLEKAMIPD